MRQQAKPLSTLQFAAVRHYVRQPPHLCETGLLSVENPVWVQDVQIVDRPANGKATLRIAMTDRSGDPSRSILLNESAYAEILMRTASGETAFIDYANDKPYPKLFGDRDNSPGITMGRALARASEGEIVTYRNGNSLDLRACNLIVTNGRSSRSWVDVYAASFWKPLPERFVINDEEYKAELRLFEERYEGLHYDEIERT